MSADWPKISTAKIALVYGEIFCSIDFGQILNVSGSISANIGIAFHCKIAVAVALIVHGVVIISSPGSIPIAPIAASRPEVHELTVTACLTLKYSSHFLSNSWTLGPP